MIQSGRIVLVVLACLTLTVAARGGELLLGVAGKSAYQVVIPDASGGAAIEPAVQQAGDLLVRMFKAQGITVPIVPEAQVQANRPAIYVGPTRFAQSQGVSFTPEQGCVYTWKVVGQNLILAGNDLPDPLPIERRTPRTAGLGGVRTLGTLKAVCEFAYRHGGARFLSPRDGDTVFLPTPVLFVPDNLDLTRMPWGINLEPARSYALYHVASGLPSHPRSLTHGGHYHFTAFDNKIDGKANPEFYVFRAGRRQTDGRHYCFSNPQVRERIYQQLLKDADAGFQLIELGQNDGFIPCDCRACYELYDVHPTRGPDEGRAYLTDPAWGEKLWIMHRDMALRLQQDRPNVKLLVSAYSVTRNPPTRVTALPGNVIVEIMRPEAQILAAWRKLDVPGGFAAYLYTWGNFHDAGYTPLRSQAEIAELARLLVDNDIRLIQINGKPVSYGIEAINIYALMRTLNDPGAPSVERLYEEFLEAAYQEAAGPMRSFYRKLHQRLLFMPDAERYASQLNRNPLLLFNTLYTPDVMTALESHLSSAEHLAKDKGVQARLGAVRMEFDFLKQIVNVVSLYHRFQMQPNEESHRLVIDAVEQRNRWLQDLADSEGRIRSDAPSFTSLPISTLRNNGRYLNVEPFNWNVEQRRQMTVKALESKRLTVSRARGPVSIDSPAWKQAAVHTLSPSIKNKAPLQKKTTFQVLYDDANLYVRVEAELDAADMTFHPRGRDAELWLQECIVLNFSPTADKSQYYYFTYDPVPESYTDAQHGFITDPLHPRFGWNDDTWNGPWTYDNALDQKNNRWVSMATVPFKTMGAEAPKAGTLWMGNVGRVHHYENKTKREGSVWADELNVSNIPGDGYFGEWIFE